MSAPGPSRQIRSRRKLVALVGAIVLVASACGAESGSGTAADAASADRSASVLSGEYATLAGDTIDLGSLEGQDVVFWFWAPW